MKFRTEIEIPSFPIRIDHRNRMLALGSCFAGHMAQRLSAARFRITGNPTGVLFNPLSIAEAIRSYNRPVEREQLHHDGHLWFHDGFHGDFSASDPQQALAAMNLARRTGAEALDTADRILLTFGTAWVFERQGAVVANCHRQPASVFTRRRLTLAQITTVYDELLAGPLAGKEVILSVSPVRHLGDTLPGNAVSKATLRLAAEELAEKHPNVHYFPAFELLTDDLRDYRFYADDLVHPAPQAIEYVWEKFSEALFSEPTRQTITQVEAILAAAAHRPRDPHSQAHKRFCQQQLERIAALPELDFSAEQAYFRHCLEINS